MIQANELRIGNWVAANSPAMIVKEINQYEVGLYMPNSEADLFHEEIEKLEPIPLTEDILLKCGFEKEYFGNNLLGYNNGDFNIYRKPTGNNDLLPCFKENIASNVPIKYLHQLQNVHHSLTGKELTINL